MVKSSLVLSFFLMTLYLLIGQAQVYSTLQGGPWDQPSTWVDGVVPAPGDDVVLVGPVTVEGLTFCHNLTIEPGGSLMAQSNVQPYMFTASGTIWNQGTIDGDNTLFPLAFTIGGDLYNEGTWKSFQIVFEDTLNHILRAEPGSLFSPTFVYADSAHIISDRDAFLDNVEFRAHKLELQLDHVTQQPTTFHFLNGSILRVDEVIGQDNAIAGDASSWINGAIGAGAPLFQDVHIQGETLLNTNVTVNGSIVIDDTLRIIDNFNNSRTITVTGNIENNGAILENNHGYGLMWDCEGNVSNMGFWQSNFLNFTGTGTYYLYTDLNDTFNPTQVWALTSTVVSDTSLRFDDVDIKIRKLVLQPGHDLFLQLNSTLRVDSLVGNHNRIHCNDNSLLEQTATIGGAPVYQNVILDGTARTISNLMFEGNLVVEGVFQVNDNFNNPLTITVTGNIQNQGSIVFNNHNYGLLFNIDGNLENAGQWQSGPVELNGTAPQQAAIPDSAMFQATFRIHAMRTGNQYQWLRNGIPLNDGGNLSGTHTAILSFSAISPADFGTYQCQIDSNGVTIYSREVQINDVITGITPDEHPVSDESQTPATFQLGQNYPNPFNPSTTIFYQLPRSSYVRLTVYDLLGREIITLVNREQPAGEYSVKLNAVNLPSGIYLYRLEAGSFIQTRKMMLLK